MSLLEQLPYANVKRLVFGRGSVAGLGTELGKYLAVTMPIPWQQVQGQLGAPPIEVVEVQDMDLAHAEALEQAAPPCETVVAVGGGQSMDMGKYIAWKRGLPLVNVPTIVSTNAYVTQSIGVRNQGKVEYIGSVTPELVIVDYDLIRTAPPELNIAGCGDILSIHTASFDWEMASAAGQEPLGFSAEAVTRARGLLQRLSDAADDIRALTDDGIRTIVECYLEINDICIPLGHYRAEEGPEHFFAYNVEYLTQRTFVHGWIVGLGIQLMSQLQGNDPEGIERLMNRLGLTHTPRVNGLTRADVARALETLRERTIADERWYSVIQQRGVSSAFIEPVMSTLEYAEG
jgi:glycerol dehydrogenase-like iron-containing ADH family enzyme